jgi:hemerythrin-like metal-binding protein
MAYVDWTDKLSVHVDSIDAQHKKLVVMVNDLFDAMKGGHGKEALIKTLDTLVSYTATHFKTEEELFAKTGYPAAAEHKKEHEEMVKKVVAIQDKVKSGVSSALSMEVLEFLKKWLVNHIQGTDQKYSSHMVSKGIK